ncbi:oligomeric golgi complex component, COG2-domain-containing protein [Geopyxis carbonaria]|nr:oligomeric golgi complex component, COG2-domain-containing protein [Geopyxis carbonaria]
MSFQLGAPSPSDSDSDSGSDLPFPAPLAADAFSRPDASFSPHAFLSSLRNRHQTLEDLRSELRTRSRDLERELVELVNRDYADFIGLGRAVEGGDGRVEDLRVGLMGFRREVEGVVAKIEGVREEVGRGLREKEEVRGEKMLARRLLALVQRVDELAALLLLEEEGGEAAHPPGFLDDGEGLTSPRRLQKLVGSWVYVQQFLLPKIPAEHPFLKTQQPRLEKIRKTILIDLGSALKEVRGNKEEGRYLEVLGWFADMGAEAEAVKMLREGKRS